MVSFLCDGCNKTLRLKQVALHFNSCNRCHTVSCVDCGKSFKESEYNAHKACMTEVQKYDRPNFDNKTPKGVLKQEDWMSSVKSGRLRYKGRDAVVKVLLEKLSSVDNVPRKRPKFVNFIKSSFHTNNPKTIDAVWEAIQPAPVDPALDSNNTVSVKRPADEAIMAEPPQKKDTERFSFSSSASVILQSKGGTLTAKKLFKKLFKEYSAVNEGDSLDDQEMMSKMKKKLRRCPFIVYNETDDVYSLNVEN